MSTERYSSIDQLRFIAAITVAISYLIIAKTGNNIKLEIISSISVEVFFIISGFVLAPQILKITYTSKIIDYKIFLIRRWYRTVPLYVLSLVLTSIILNKLFTFDFLKYLFFIQNFFVIFVNIDYFSISWSLSVEEWFYIIFPLFLILVSKTKYKKTSKYIICSTISFILIIFFLRMLFIYDENWGSNVRRIVLFRLDSIAFGFLLFFLKNKIKPALFNELVLLIIFIISSIFLFKILETNVTQHILFYKIIFHFVVALWGSIMVLMFYLLNNKIKNMLFININFFLGKMSYSIYLFHLMTIYLISPLNFSLELNILIFLILQLTISSILYYYFEKPILNLRPNYK